MSIFNFNSSKAQSQRLEIEGVPGFLLFEVMVALMIVTGLCLGMASWYTGIVRKQAYIVDKLYALTLAGSLLEFVRAHKTTQGSSVVQPGFSVRWQFKKSPTVTNLTFVTVFVGWQKDKERHEISLSTAFVGVIAQ